MADAAAGLARQDGARGPRITRRFWEHIKGDVVTTSAKQPDFKALQRQTQTRFYGLFVWARLAIVPLIVTMAAWIGLGDSRIWRQVLMGSVVVGLSSVSLWDVVNFTRRRTVTTFAIYRNMVMANVALTIMVFSTGALESPIIPMIAIMALADSLFVSPRMSKILVFGLLIPSVWLWAVISVYELMPRAIPDVFGGGSRDGVSDVLLWTTAVVLTALMTAFLNMGLRIKASFLDLVVKVLRERDEALLLHAEQAQTLTTLSGEIAHELKNPLASIKGLSALLARKLEGQEAERLAVLRREVDRMQNILQEFLNFSRPLVPLSQEERDLSELAREVIDLHEGMARDAKVDLELDAEEPTSCICDPRKIKQVLINLVQNALDASPPGGGVLLEVAKSSDDELVLRVIDQGHGLAPELAERIFDPGVTSKARGSGLGLTVARAIARQHGGELTLRTGEQGGCVAEMTLPLRSGKREQGTGSSHGPA